MGKKTYEFNVHLEYTAVVEADDEGDAEAQAMDAATSAGGGEMTVVSCIMADSYDPDPDEEDTEEQAETD